MRRACLALSVLIALAAAAPAGAQQRRAELTASGALTVTWQGDAARGCAAAGVCEVSGRSVLPVDARGQLFSPGGRQVYGFLYDDRSAAVVRVERRTGAQPTPICVDAPGGGGFGPGGFSVNISGLRGGRARVRLQPGLPIGAGRCSGPLPSDLDRVLPSATASASRLLAGSTAVDLGGRAAFAAGPYSGELVSTVRLTVGQARVRARRGGPPRRRPPGRRVVTTFRTVAIDYAISSARGAITSAFGALPAPECGALDACGLAGTTVLTPRLEGTPLRLRARDRRGTRAGSVADALRDVRAGRLRLNTGYGRPADASVRGTAQRGAAGPVCEDDGGRGAVRLQSSRRGGRLVFELRGAQFYPSRAVLRSRCPGPGITPDTVLARGSLAVARVGGGVLTLRLAATGRDTAPGFASRQRTGEIVVRLRPSRVRVGTERRTRYVR